MSKIIEKRSSTNKRGTFFLSFSYYYYFKRPQNLHYDNRSRPAGTMKIIENARGFTDHNNALHFPIAVDGRSDGKMTSLVLSVRCCYTSALTIVFIFAFRVQKLCWRKRKELPTQWINVNEIILQRERKPRGIFEYGQYRLYTHPCRSRQNVSHMTRRGNYAGIDDRCASRY